uniref:BRCT domain-containing protein n=1 Tax=Eutreptiella gymnastica TaxID=73025 RepID=A0A7S1N3X5_9EUGL
MPFAVNGIHVKPKDPKHALLHVFRRVLQGKVFLIDLPLAQRDEARSGIIGMGGQIVYEWREGCTHLLTENPAHCTPENAARGLVVITTQWIEDCETYCRAVKCTGNIVYTPMKPLSAMANCLISQSGFANPIRRRIKYLINVMGASYTESLSKYNTHVVVPLAGYTSAKIAGARKWGVKVVHWCWLHDCVQQGVLLPEEPYMDAKDMPDATVYFAPPKDLKEFCRLYILQFHAQIDFAAEKYGLTADLLSYLGEPVHYSCHGTVGSEGRTLESESGSGSSLNSALRTVGSEGRTVDSESGSGLSLNSALSAHDDVKT